MQGLLQEATSSGILDAAASANWAEINSFDPQKGVSIRRTLRKCCISMMDEGGGPIITLSSGLICFPG